EMMGRCLDSDLPFGVVLSLAESTLGHEVPAHVGTMARIVDYERLPDGRYNLLASGTERFEIVELRTTHAYLTALVRPLGSDCEALRQGDDVSALVPCAREALETYLRQMLVQVGSPDCEISIPTEPIELSYVIGM